MNTPIAHSVLIVEDERVIAKDIQETLQGMGYDAFATASSAAEALARVKERCPDLVLMDIRIEGTEDGIETAKLLSALHDVPVVFLTAHADEETIERAREAAPYGFLAKPVKPADLRGAIETSVYRQSIDRRLRERERWFSTTLSSVADAVVTTDLDGRLTYLNPAAETLLGTSADQAIGKPAEEVMRFAEPIPGFTDKTPLATAIRLGKPLRITSAQLVNPSTGARSTISDTCAPVLVDGAVSGAVMVFRDDTEKRAVARQLEIADRLAALGTMAAGTAHELNNPLAVITSNIENAIDALHRHAASLEQGASPAGQIPQLRDISLALADVRMAAARMRRIVSDLRGLAPSGQQAPRIVDLAKCIDWATRATAHEFRNRAQVEQRLGATPTVLADDARLGQVLVNLLVNAAHAIAPGDLEHNRVVIGTGTDEAGRAVIAIRDTGKGMTPEILKRIFDPFFTTKDIGAGTGLGLAISHGIVSSMGGILRADSTPGEGSTFEILLPPAPATGGAAAPTEARERPHLAGPLRRGRILVVDDEAMLLQAICSTLEIDGHAVVTQDNARDALELIARGETFDVILTDLSMPNMTGMEFHAALLERDARFAQRVIFMSGGAVTSKAEKFLEGLAHRYITKPFKNADLRGAIQRVLSELPRDS
jgi:PAS domain S-box-containing protein